MRRLPITVALAVFTLCLLVGCGQDASYEQAATDATDAAKDLATKAQETGGDLMAGAEAAIEKLPEELKAKAEEYKEKILAQQTKIDELKAKLAEVSPQDLLAGKGKELKDESEAAMSELTELKSKLKEILDQAAG
ncbi:MAG: hypothetical protein GY722_27175 [bacterium]|nr:hypothetical protein [bacterium]